MAQLNFDANNVDPQSTFDPIPADDYTVMVIDSDMKPTKNNMGKYLELTLQVVEGPMNGRLIWDRLNLVNQNQQAVEIAQRQLSAICHAVGVMNVTDSVQLHNIPMVARVTYVEASGQYQAKNEVKGYKPVGGATAQPQAQAPAARPTPANPAPAARPAAPAGGASTPPWAAR